MALVNHLLKQKIDYIYSVVKDGYGQETLTEVYNNIPCRWQGTSRLMAGPSGEMVNAAVEAWIKPIYTLSTGMRVIKDDAKYTIISQSTKYSLSGKPDHIKLWLV